MICLEIRECCARCAGDSNLKQINSKVFDEIYLKELHRENNNTRKDVPKHASYEIENWTTFSKRNKERGANAEELKHKDISEIPCDPLEVKLSKNMEYSIGYNNGVSLEEALEVLHDTTKLVTVETHISDNTSNRMDESANLPCERMEQDEHGEGVSTEDEAGNSNKTHPVCQTLENQPVEAALEIKTIFPVQDKTDDDSRSSDQKFSDVTVQTSNRDVEIDKSNVLSDVADDISNDYLWITSNSFRDCWNMPGVGDPQQVQSGSRNNVPGRRSFLFKVFRMVLDVVSFIQYYSFTYVLRYILFI